MNLPAFTVEARKMLNAQFALFKGYQTDSPLPKVSRGP